MKTYITFGQNHVHRVKGKTLDCDSVAVIECNSAEEGRNKAFEYFGPRFSMEYPEQYWKEDEQLKYFPRGYINI